MTILIDPTTANAPRPGARVTIMSSPSRPQGAVRAALESAFPEIRFDYLRKHWFLAGDDAATRLEHWRTHSMDEAVQTWTEQLAVIEKQKATRRAEREAEREAEETREAETAAATPATPRSKIRRLYPLKTSPEPGTAMRLNGEWHVVEGRGKTFRITADHPSMWGSHLLGFEGSSGAYSYFRPATDAEIAAAERAEADRKTFEARRDAVNAERGELERRAIDEGERPSGGHDLVGEHLLSTQDICGGGEWWVVAENAVWFVQNRGMDGDNWAANNVNTAGAGAVGWRLPRDNDLVAALRRLDAEARDLGMIN